MSVKTMGQVWDLDNNLIDREEKYVLLAYADHADHEGRNMFPSIELICKKTGYKERSVQLITRSLEEKGFLIADGHGPKGTNKWAYGGGAKIAGVQKIDDGGAKVTGEGVQPIAPEPLRTIEPSLPKGDLLDAEIHYNLKPNSIRQAISKCFFINVNWETKTARQWMEWAVSENITPDQIARAADLWRSSKTFNWQTASLKGIYEKWPMLMQEMQGKTTTTDRTGMLRTITQ